MTKDNQQHHSLLPRELAKPICERCKKQVYCDEGYHGATLNHWNCEARHELSAMHGDPFRALRLFELGMQFNDEVLRDLEPKQGDRK